MFIRYIDKIWPIQPIRSKYQFELTRDQLRLLANVVEATGGFKAAVKFFPQLTPGKIKYIYYFLIRGYQSYSKMTYLLTPQLSECELRKIDSLFSRKKGPLDWKAIAVLFPYIRLNDLKKQYYHWKKIEPQRKPMLKKLLTEEEQRRMVELYNTYKCWKKLKEFYPGYSEDQIKHYYRTVILGLDLKSVPKVEELYWTPEKSELFKKLWTSEKDLSVIRKAFPYKSPAKLYAQAEKMGIRRLEAVR